MTGLQRGTTRTALIRGILSGLAFMGLVQWGLILFEGVSSWSRAAFAGALFGGFQGLYEAFVVGRWLPRLNRNTEEEETEKGRGD